MPTTPPSNFVKSTAEDGEADAISQAMERLNTAQHKAAEALYKTAQASEAPPAPEGDAAPDEGASGGTSADGDVIDAEVVEDEKK